MLSPFSINSPVVLHRKKQRSVFWSDDESLIPRIREVDSSDAETIINQSLKRHGELWFDDGSVVLAVDKALFRVHRTILTSHSKVFADMFTLPPSEYQEMMEGCPLIHLHDSATDFVHLLKTLYDPFYLQTTLQSFNVDFISAILRLSTKYDIPRLRQTAIDKLKEGFPSSLDSFDDPTFHASRAAAKSHVIQVINLARETNVPEVLPCAFYYCCSLPMTKILMSDGPHSLSKDDAVACLLGREALLNLHRLGPYSFLYGIKTSRRCTHSCESKSPEGLVQYLRSQDPSVVLTFEPFTEWVILGACPPCLVKTQTLYHSARRQIWGTFPQFFLLETWDVMTKVQNR